MTNDSARGYIVLVLKNLGYKEEDIDKILDELHLCFDTITEYEKLEKLNDNNKNNR